MSIRRRLLRTFIVFAVLCAVIAALGSYSYMRPGPQARSGDATIVELKRGMGLYDIAEALKAGGVITDAGVFAIIARATGNGASLKAGEYSIPTHASMAEIVQILEHGKVILHRLTIPEGLTSVQVVRLVADNDVLVGESGTPPPEGSLLPETYSFPRGTTREELLGEMHAAHDKLIAELWQGREDGLPFKTPQQAVILASIVEKETAKPDERGRVAAVYINRLERGMLLQSDPTVIYGISGGEPLGRGLKESELLKATPYNTYVNAGLPPTPIDNPGRASIEAVLHPPKSDELYFVADGSGGHVFAVTLEEHQANVRKWRKYERQFLEAGSALRPSSLPQATAH